MSWEEVAEARSSPSLPFRRRVVSPELPKERTPHILQMRQLGLQIWLITTQSDTAS